LDAALKKENVTADELKDQIRRQLAIREYVNKEFSSKTEISDDELKEYYEKNPLFFKQPEMVKASHILIKLDPKANEVQKKEAMEKIEDIKKQVDEGKDFSELAETYSEGPSKTTGGDLGFFPRGKMVKPFEDAAFSLKPGEVSPIVETRFGYHIIKVFEVQEEGVLSLDEAEPKIRKALTLEKTRVMVEKKLEELKKQAEIEKFPNVTTNKNS
jgi:peptidyl-prolyl cis-trans isomerase C